MVTLVHRQTRSRQSEAFGNALSLATSSTPGSRRRVTLLRERISFPVTQGDPVLGMMMVSAVPFNAVWRLAVQSTGSYATVTVVARPVRGEKANSKANAQITCRRSR